MHFLLGVIILLFSASIAYSDAIPVTTPIPLSQIQDPLLVKEHILAAQKIHNHKTPPIPSNWISQITEKVILSSHRSKKPCEDFGVIFTKTGEISHLLAVFPCDANYSSNQMGTSHKTFVAEYDNSDKKLDLSLGDTSGPSGYELFGIDQLPLIAQEIVSIQKLQKAFISNGLNYSLEASVIVNKRGRDWAWLIGPSGEQSPNIIYGMYYRPISGVLVVRPIRDKVISQKVEQAVSDAGMIQK